MEFVADRLANPFDIDFPCDRVVPGYGDTGALFHVIGDHPGVHGGFETGVPFTDRPWSRAFFDALEQGGLVRSFDLATGTVEPDRTFFSYRYACDPGSTAPTDGDFADLEPFFDAELRAITAHVLLPVGPGPIRHVLENYTARSTADLDVAALHGTEVRGSGWLVVPVADPGTWTADDADRLVAGLTRLRRTDFRRESDLGRFLPGGDPYFVR